MQGLLHIQNCHLSKVSWAIDPQLVPPLMRNTSGSATAVLGLLLWEEGSAKAVMLLVWVIQNQFSTLTSSMVSF